MVYDSRWFHTRDMKRPFLRPVLGPPPCPPLWPRSSLFSALSPAFRRLSALDASYHDDSGSPNPATGHSIAAPRYDGTVWEKLRHSIRTEAFNTGTFNIGTDSGIEKRGKPFRQAWRKGNFLPFIMSSDDSPSMCIRMATPCRPSSSRLPIHTGCSYKQYKRHTKATFPPRTASRFSLASS